MTEFLPIKLYAFIYHSIFESDSAVSQIVISYDLIFTLFHIDYRLQFKNVLYYIFSGWIKKNSKTITNFIPPVTYGSY